MSSRDQFFRVLQGVILEITRGIFPILHFEMHGSDQLGLMVGEHQYVAWSELANCLRPVNVLTGGNLFVGIAACHGANTFQPQDVDKASPFYALVAPRREVSVGLIQQSYAKLYESLFTNPVVFSKVAKSLPEEFELLHAELLFTQTIVELFVDQLSGSNRTDMIERVVTNAVNLSPIRSPEALRSLRSKAKALIRPNKAIFESLARRFIVKHDAYMVSFEEIMELVEHRRGRI